MMTTFNTACCICKNKKVTYSDIKGIHCFEHWQHYMKHAKYWTPSAFTDLWRGFWQALTVVLMQLKLENHWLSTGVQTQQLTEITQGASETAAHWPTLLLLHQYHAVLVPVTLWYSLKSGRLILPAPFFFLKTALAIQGLLCFYMNLEIFCSNSVKNGNLIGIALNL